jgi:hypothetical protein
VHTYRRFWFIAHQLDTIDHRYQLKCVKTHFDFTIARLFQLSFSFSKFIFLICKQLSEALQWSYMKFRNILNLRCFLNDSHFSVKFSNATKRFFESGNILRLARIILAFRNFLVLFSYSDRNPPEFKSYFVMCLQLTARNKNEKK